MHQKAEHYTEPPEFPQGGPQNPLSSHFNFISVFVIVFDRDRHSTVQFAADMMTKTTANSQLQFLVETFYK